MKKIISLGKIDFYGIKRKINLVTLEIELKEKDNKKILSICGNVWNNKKTDIIYNGQCLDDLFPFYKNNKLFQKIYRLWKLYHLNDMHAGTPKQEKFLNDNIQKHNWDYKKCCNLLKRHGLLHDNGYEYGTNWLYEAIPENDLKLIYEIIEG